MNAIEATIKINAMLSDNFKFLALFLLITGILLAIFLYFLYQIVLAVKLYYQNVKKSQSEPGTDNTIGDDENYNANTKIDPSQFIGAKKRAYLDKVESKFANYNQEKQEWIQRNFGKQTDYDLINDDILYRKHDNYSK